MPHRTNSGPRATRIDRMKAWLGRGVRPTRLAERPAPARSPVGLALQGGGSWGAYTWGVLDTLLASRSVDIVQLSGTSAGAINAAIVASALAGGSRVRAREALRSFWLSMAGDGRPQFAGEWLEPLE